MFTKIFLGICQNLTFVFDSGKKLLMYLTYWAWCDSFHVLLHKRKIHNENPLCNATKFLCNKIKAAFFSWTKKVFLTIFLLKKKGQRSHIFPLKGDSSHTHFGRGWLRCSWASRNLWDSRPLLPMAGWWAGLWRPLKDVAAVWGPEGKNVDELFMTPPPPGVSDGGGMGLVPPPKTMTSSPVTSPSSPINSGLLKSSSMPPSP